VEKTQSPGWRFQLAVFAGAFAVVWAWTSSFGLALVNWDNSAYLGFDAMASVKHTPLYLWNNHFGVGHFQHVGAVIARLFGGTTLDGFRLFEALFFAGACTIVADGLSRILGERRLALAITAAWALTWVNVFLIMTLEYNTCFLLTGAGVLWLVTQHDKDWRPRHSIYAGLLIAVGVLVSWQAAPYLLPAGYAALLAGRTDSVSRRQDIVRRLRDAALVAVVFVGAFAVWTLIVAPFSSHSIGELYRVQFSRPQPAFIPSSPWELIKLLANLGTVTYSFGAALSYMLQHTMYDLTVPFWAPNAIGGVALAGQAALLWWTTRLWRREKNAMLHVLALSLFVLTMVTSIYKDITYAYLKRFNFIPLFGAFFLALLIARRPKWSRRNLAILFFAVAVVEAGLAIRWERNWRAGIFDPATYRGTPPKNTFYGRDHMSWPSHFAKIRRENPSACRYVFAYSEVSDAKWLWEIPAALWNELGDKHLILDLPPGTAGSKMTLESTSAALFATSSERGCAWISPGAAKLLK
jgi:hypothetical protein